MSGNGTTKTEANSSGRALRITVEPEMREVACCMFQLAISGQVNRLWISDLPIGHFLRWGDNRVPITSLDGLVENSDPSVLFVQLEIIYL